MKQEGPLYYPLGRNRPLHAKAGCWVYFVRDGAVVARAKVDRILRQPAGVLYTYTGAVRNSDGWHVECSAMELAKKRIPHPGFQGFRYVTADEQSVFEAAFR